MRFDMPETVLEVVVEREDQVAHLLGVGAGYEDQRWRFRAITWDLFQWASDWILTPDELEGFGPNNSNELMGKALHRIYSTKKYQKRGEVGELLLHIVLRRFMRSQKVISRIFFKDASNDTVKGFDAAHVIENSQDSELELWLGESKFYTSSVSAFTAVLSELQLHLSTDYLRLEFAAISDKIPRGWKHETILRKLLARTISLDDVFKRVVIPIFVTYDSAVMSRHTADSEDYRREIENELLSEWQDFKSRLGNQKLPRAVRVHLILLPMSTKKDLIDAFDERLKNWQAALKP